jgi:hypothetical protein
MVNVKKLPILLIKRGVNVEQKNDVQTTTSLLRTEQQRKGTKRINRNGQTNQRSRKEKSTNIIL